MRHSLVLGLVFLGLLALPAYLSAQQGGPPTDPPARWQLVGFTSTVIDGAAGGPLNVTLLCQAEVHPRSRICKDRHEVAETTTVPTPLLTDPLFRAWVELASCSNWTEATVVGATVSGGGAIAGNSACTESLPVACCALVP